MLYHLIILLTLILCSDAYGQPLSPEKNNKVNTATKNATTTNELSSEKNTETSRENIEVINVTGYTEIKSSNYKIIQREDFISGSQTLPDVLKTVNGIQIRQISGIGNPTSVSIRGSSSQQVQFYIDGQLVNDGMFGGFDLTQIPTEQIESIEVSKSQSIGTGSTPIGGVVRINTYNPTEDKAKLSLSLGSFGYQDANAIVNNAFKLHSLAIGASYLTSDNDYEYLVPQSFYHPSSTIVEPLRNNGFEKYTLFLNDTAVLGQHQLRFNIQYNQQEKALANYQNNSPENSSYIESESLRYSYQHTWASDIQGVIFDGLNFDDLELELYHDDKDELYLNSPNSIRKEANDYHTIKNHAGLNALLSWSAFNFTPYIDWNKQQFTSSSEKNGIASTCNGISTCDVLAKQQQLNLGGRLAWHNTDNDITAYTLLNMLAEENSNIPLNQVDAELAEINRHYQTQEVGLTYKIENYNLYTHWSSGIRTPTLFELFGDRGSFKGNDDLLPEKAKTTSIGLSYTNKNTSLTSSLYHKELTDSIVAIFNSSGIGSYQNVDSALVNGIEIQGNVDLHSKLSMVLQATYIDSVTSSTDSSDGKKLPGIYHQQYSAGFQYRFIKQWKATLRTSIDNDLYFNRYNLTGNNNSNLGSGNPANRIVTDLTLSWKSAKQSASIRMNNIFDANYQDLANRPAQGINIQFKYSIEDL